jgi:hypothetical protein
LVIFYYFRILCTSRVREDIVFIMMDEVNQNDVDDGR